MSIANFSQTPVTRMCRLLRNATKDGFVAWAEGRKPTPDERKTCDDTTRASLVHAEVQARDRPRDHILLNLNQVAVCIRHRQYREHVLPARHNHQLPRPIVLIGFSAVLILHGW